MEDQILDRFRQKSASAGGPRAGYVLRRYAIARGVEEADPEAVEAALGALVERGLLAASEKRDFYFLTAAGVEAIGGGST